MFALRTSIAVPEKYATERETVRLVAKVERAIGLALIPLAVVVGSCARSGDRRTESAAEAPELVSHGAMDDSTCLFVRAPHHADGDALVRTFVQRAAEGTFARSEDWLPTALDCVGHEPGYDVFFVLDSRRLTQLPAGADTVRYTLHTKVGGNLIGGQFEPDSGQRVDTIIAYRTPFGWRIASPAFWNWMSPEAARAKGWRVP